MLPSVRDSCMKDCCNLKYRKVTDMSTTVPPRDFFRLRFPTLDRTLGELYYLIVFMYGILNIIGRRKQVGLRSKFTDHKPTKTTR